MSALQSLWMLTRHETEFHDWDDSSKQDRQAWVRNGSNGGMVQRCVRNSGREATPFVVKPHR